VIADVSVVVENIGVYSASEVAQLYIGIPGAPEKQLRGYQKKTINPGQRTTVHFE
jgi:beta-glucosidase